MTANPPPPPDGHIWATTVVDPDVTMRMLVPGDKDAVGKRLLESLRKACQEHKAVEAKLANTAMLARAPAEVIDGLRARLMDTGQRVHTIVSAILDL